MQQQTPAAHPGATFYEGKVTHVRRRPVENSFEYPVRMALVDLQQQPPWFQQHQAADHMSAEQAQKFAGTDGKVLLLSNPVVAGYAQNPISVYFCYDAAGKLAKAISEVTNTPWGDRVTFLFNTDGDVSPKALHVSPFMDMQNTWHLKATDPAKGPGLSVSVLVRHPTLGAYFDAHLLLQRCPEQQQCLPEQGGLASLLRFGFMPQRVAFWIYWQAVRLIAKGCPIHAKPASSSFRPAVSSSSKVQPSGLGVKTACTCVAGKYRTSNGDCTDCPKNFYCPGNGAGKVVCGNGLITAKRGAVSKNNCVNPPGYKYVKTATTVKAEACGNNTYSLGLKQQPTCNPCPPGFVTDPDNNAGTHTSAAVCLAAPGMYMLGDTVVPCPKGEFSDSFGRNTACTSCESLFGQGVTTATTNSTSKDQCSWSETGFALVDDKGKVILGALGTNPAQVVAGARPCPQSYYCPGGDPAVAASQPTKCDTDLAIVGRLWTEGEGATSDEDCVAPPGWARSTGTTVVECASGTYKSTWDNTAACTSCGSGVWVSNRRSWITATDAYSQPTKQFKVRGSSESCYIQPGMGATVSHDADGNVELKAMVCPANYFGITANKWGVVATPCQACPANSRTGFNSAPAQYKAASYYTTADDMDTAPNTLSGLTEPTEKLTRDGYYNVTACYTKPGYGYYSGAASICPKGYYNAGDNREPCTRCPNGKSTFFEGSTSLADCMAYAAGYGKVGSAAALCYTGTYNDGSSEVCLPCPLGTTTDVTGATSNANTLSGNPVDTFCKLCAPGYGGSSATECATGATTAAKLCQDGYYGSPSRTGSDTACATCPTGRRFTYTYTTDDVYLPGATSRYGANSADDCIAAALRSRP
ncbi:hypothetical protein OEZ85_012483 [Tetradesmus obliquus]|uniref:Tyrosine-protein kinase ephrin type A/B receptor-like domain-containing protein n=1 Tax=Tetradesmus obliquus TaxID=3088 RepID=A0ABY8TTH6_TETOB|nr:hypothetical protein OEZ85_012483 [Tetradesmus obliquus]